MSVSQQENAVCPHCTRTFKRNGLQRHIRASHVVQTLSQPNSHTDESHQRSPLEEAFNAPYSSNNESLRSDVWKTFWNRICKFSGRQYDLPFGSVSRRFVHKLADEMNYLIRSQFPSERLLVFNTVILQREKNIKRGKDVRQLLTRRLNLWEEGEFENLVCEATKCDKSLKKNSKKTCDESEINKIFTRLVLRGKIRDAVNWLLSNKDKAGVLHPNSEVDDTGKTVMDVLKEKHPLPSPPDHSLFKLPNDMPGIPCLLQVDITTDHVEKVARKLHGGGGTSGVTSEHWTDYLLHYGQASFRLRESVAGLTMKLNNQPVPWHEIQALMSSRLIALDKCPGVRPIGIGECLRRILSKCMIEVTGSDVTEACAELQLCGGIKGGIEGAIHAMNELFQDQCLPGTKWGMLLVDANNAFNTINRQLALWQARIHWPRCARFLYNCYQGHAELVIRGSDVKLYSREGVTQGDPLAMPLYALATLPIIQSLKRQTDVTQCWYADDSSAQGTFEKLRSWWDILKDQGPQYGYFPQGKKSILIVSEVDVEEAQNIFRGTEIIIKTGARFLGGYIGDDKNAYVDEKVKHWISNMDKLSKVCKESPQAAYTALTKAIQFQWSFFQRVVQGVEENFIPLNQIIREKFLPALIGGDISMEEADLFSLPVNKAGLAITNPVNTAKLNFEVSKTGNKKLSDAIIKRESLDLEQHFSTSEETRRKYKKEKNITDDQYLEVTLTKFNSIRQRAIERSIFVKTKTKSSAWLSTIPLKKKHFDLSPTEFKDALAMRYHRHPISMPENCDGCGKKDFNLDHALCCKTGGLINRRHNEIRDLFGELCKNAWGNVTIEPTIFEDESSGLRGDLACRGVWDAQRETLFDIRVIDTDAPSYVSRPVSSVISSAEEEKKRKYLLACEQHHLSFSPLVMTVDGVFAPQTNHFIRTLADRLASRWERPHSQVTGWLRARIAVAILRASSMCIRGTRRKWRTNLIGFEDGAGI